MDTGSREDTSQAVEVETEIRDNVPDTLDYDGEAITCLSLGVQETAIGQITILGLTGDAINDHQKERLNLEKLSRFAFQYGYLCAGG